MELFQLVVQILQVHLQVALRGDNAVVPGHVLHLADVVLIHPVGDQAVPHVQERFQ